MRTNGREHYDLLAICIGLKSLPIQDPLTVPPPAFAILPLVPLRVMSINRRRTRILCPDGRMRLGAVPAPTSRAGTSARGGAASESPRRSSNPRRLQFCGAFQEVFVNRLQLRMHRIVSRLGAVRSSLVLATVLGLSSLVMMAATAPTASAATRLYYQRGYYLQAGWVCYGWANGAHSCNHPWSRTSNGHLVSQNVKWAPDGLDGASN